MNISRSLKSKILVLTLLPICFTLLIIGGISIYNKARTERQLLLNRLMSYRTLLESGDLSFDSSRDKTKLEALLDEKVEFTEIVRKDYSVIYTTENSAISVIEKSEKKEIDEAFSGTETTKNIRRGGKSALVTITPLIVKGQVVAVLHQAVSNERSGQRVLSYAVSIALFTLAGIFLCYASISYLLKDAVLRHIYTLKQATLHMLKGNLTMPVIVDTNDEIGDFAKAFEQMRQQVNDANIKLVEYNKQLERRIKDRTSELEKNITELERVNKLMIGREMMMIEIKKQMESLRQQLASATH